MLSSHLFSHRLVRADKTLFRLPFLPDSSESCCLHELLLGSYTSEREKFSKQRGAITLLSDRTSVDGASQRYSFIQHPVCLECHTRPKHVAQDHQTRYLKKKQKTKNSKQARLLRDHAFVCFTGSIEFLPLGTKTCNRTSEPKLRK